MTSVTSVAHRAGHALLRRGRGSLRVILTRYTLGSVIAAIVSELALLIVYGTELAGPEVAAGCAWICGATVNYLLNRSWTWDVRGRPPLRELVPYWIVAVASLGVSTWTTSMADRFAPALTDDRNVVVVIVGACFLATYGVLFVAKFLLFHFVLFKPRPTAATAAPPAPSDALHVATGGATPAERGASATTAEPGSA